MDTFLSYLIRSVLISGLMLGYYLAVLRNRKLHSFNRVWLLTALLASLVLPLIHVNFLTWHSAAQPPLAALIAGAHPAAAKTIPVMALVVAAFGAVSVGLLAILGFRVALVYRDRRRHRRQLLEGCWLIEVRDRRAPYSFLGNLFWQEGADIHDPVHRKILDHELAHIRGGHTYDNLFAQTLAAVFWVNPFYWLIRRELRMVHEFIADGASIATGDTETFARMLLQAYDDGRYLDPSHHFFHSPIKRRLLMISSSKPPSRLRKALALPVLLVVVALACSKEQDAPAQITKPLYLTLAKQFKITRDSIQVAFAPSLRRALENGITKANKDGQVVHITLDTLGMKMRMDLSPGVEVEGMNDKVPPPPPPKWEPSSN
jgi:hypothetical protein